MREEGENRRVLRNGWMEKGWVHSVDPSLSWSCRERVIEDCETVFKVLKHDEDKTNYGKW